MGHTYPTHLHPRNASLTLPKMLISLQRNFDLQNHSGLCFLSGFCNPPQAAGWGAVAVSWGSCSCLYPGLWLVWSISLHA